MAMREASYSSLGPHGFHRLAYTEWGRADNPRVVVCVHGLTRTGRDFDALAAALEKDYRLVCPDMPGRGKSDWLAAKEDYEFTQYCTDLTVLLARLGVDKVDWVGTSMGGIIGMMLAAQPNSPIGRLFLNDIGPVISKPGLEAISQYVGASPEWDDLDAAARYFRETRTGFGPLDDDGWRRIAEHAVREGAGGKLVNHYDPKIGERFLDAPADEIEMWPMWDAISCPVAVLRGGVSLLLTEATTDEMSRRGAKAHVRVAPEYGHAPPLMSEEQIGVVRDWLAA